MTSHLGWIDAAAAFVEVEGLRYRVGQRTRSLSRYVSRYNLPPDLASAFVINALAADLYETFYARGGSEPAAPLSNAAGGDLEPALRAHNHGSGPWERGWRLVREDAHRWIVRKDGLTFAVALGRARRIDEDVEVQHGPELSRLSPGFYLFLGDVWLDARATSLVRTYWHLTAAGAPRFVAALTKTLNHAREPYRAKVVSSRAGFDRRDAGVVYLARDRWADASRHLKRVADELSPFLRPGVPAMTKELQAGVGLAEDPPGNQSYGMSRCSILASALVRSAGLDGRLETRRRLIADELQANGLDQAKPFLNPQSKDTYEWPGR